MARIRNIKPGFFKDADLYDAERATSLPIRIAYAGLWTVADRAGRFKWKPREIKTDILPYDDVDMGAVMNALVEHGFIFKYKSAGHDYGYVPNFEKHQFINRNEAASQLPDPKENSNAQSVASAVSTPDDKAPETHCELLVVIDTDTDGLTQTTDSPPQAAAPKPSRKVTTTIPENFPDLGAKSAAVGYWADRDRMDLSADDEAQSFRAHHLSHGSRMSDWGQAWVTWYTRTIKFNRKPNYGESGKTGSGPAVDQHLAGIASLITDVRAGKN